MLKLTKQENRTGDFKNRFSLYVRKCRTRVLLRVSLTLPLLAGVIFAFLSFTSNLSAQEGHQAMISREYEIKAAYIYNFCKYVQWPQSNSSSSRDKEPFYICILGQNPFGNALDRIAEKKTVRGRRIIIQHINSANDFRNGHIVFVPADRPDELLDDLMKKTEPYSTLIIGEEPGFASTSGIINFFKESNKVRFEINAKVAEDRNLKISSKLLRLGKIVEK